MKFITTYYKNSNTNEFIKSVETTESKIIGIPIRYYDILGNSITYRVDLTGFVQIKEKTWRTAARIATKRASRKSN